MTVRAGRPGNDILRPLWKALLTIQQEHVIFRIGSIQLNWVES